MLATSETMQMRSWAAYARKAIFGFTLSLVLAGCQTPANIQELQQKNTNLQTQLNSAKSQIGDLEAKQLQLNGEISELNRVISVLNTEKSSRVEESSNLRGSVRSFVQIQIDQMKNFLFASDLLDYVGGELLQRSKVDDKPIVLVDLANPIPTGGVVTGLGGYFDRPATFTIKVLRPVENNLVVIWESKPMSVTKTGIQRVNFASNVSVEKGDLIGYYFSTPGVSYDIGTGDTRFLEQDVKPGTVVALKSLSDKDKRRAYSIGVYGLLN
jgi:hypothetical protein